MNNEKDNSKSSGEQEEKSSRLSRVVTTAWGAGRVRRLGESRWSALGSWYSPFIFFFSLFFMSLLAWVRGSLTQTDSSYVRPDLRGTDTDWQGLKDRHWWFER